MVLWSAAGDFWSEDDSDIYTFFIISSEEEDLIWKSAKQLNAANTTLAMSTSPFPVATLMMMMMIMTIMIISV